MTLPTDVAWPSIDRLATEIHLLSEVSALSVQVGRLFISQWNMAREMRREIRALRTQVTAILHDAATIELDPDDHFTDLLLRLQDQINQTVQIQRKQLQSPISIGARWMIQWSRRLLVASHSDLGWIRVAIMEHDADVSPVSGQHFDSAEALIAHLMAHEP